MKEQTTMYIIMYNQKEREKETETERDWWERQSSSFHFQPCLNKLKLIYRRRWAYLTRGEQMRKNKKKEKKQAKTQHSNWEAKTSLRTVQCIPHTV